VTVLPNAHNVRIDPAKFTYLVTSGKALFFIRGFDPSRPMELEAAPRQHPVINPFEDKFVTVPRHQIHRRMYAAVAGWAKSVYLHGLGFQNRSAIRHRLCQPPGKPTAARRYGDHVWTK
jgi:hypothetical protein